MSELLLSAVFTAFWTVRLVRGSWLRNPQYLAVGIVGSILGAVVLRAISPDLEDDFIVGGLIGVAGSWGGILLFETAIGSA
jgi:hypothetical protein